MAILQQFGPYPDGRKILSYSTYDYFGNPIEINPAVPLTSLIAETDPLPGLVNNLTTFPRSQSLQLATGFNTLVFSRDNVLSTRNNVSLVPFDQTLPRVIEDDSRAGTFYVGFGGLIGDAVDFDSTFSRTRLISATGNNGVVYPFQDIVNGIIPTLGYTQSIKETLGTVVTTRVVNTPGDFSRIFNVVLTALPPPPPPPPPPPGEENKAFVISISTITDPTGQRDELWMCVNRNGVYTIEVMQPGWIGDVPLTDSYFSDASLTYKGPPVTTITGLTPHEGRTVQVLADGGTHPNRVVTNGEIKLQKPSSFVIVGLPYVSRAVTNRFEGGNPDGSSQGLTKKIVNVSLRLLNSLGGKIGLKGAKKIEELVYRTPQMQMDKAPPLFTGDFPKLDCRGGYDTTGQVEIIHDTPTPFCVNLITVQMEVSDR